jgi:hypothetical protein
MIDSRLVPLRFLSFSHIARRLDFFHLQKGRLHRGANKIGKTAALGEKSYSFKKTGLHEASRSGIITFTAWEFRKLFSLDNLPAPFYLSISKSVRPNSRLVNVEQQNS